MVRTKATALVVQDCNWCYCKVANIRKQGIVAEYTSSTVSLLVNWNKVFLHIFFWIVALYFSEIALYCAIRRGTLWREAVSGLWFCVKRLAIHTVSHTLVARCEYGIHCSGIWDTTFPPSTARSFCQYLGQATGGKLQPPMDAWSRPVESRSRPKHRIQFQILLHK